MNVSAEKYERSSGLTLVESCSILEDLSPRLGLHAVGKIAGNLKETLREICDAKISSEVLCACSQCTFENVAKDSRCTMCGGPIPVKPAPYHSIDAAKADPFSFRLSSAAEAGLGYYLFMQHVNLSNNSIYQEAKPEDFIEVVVESTFNTHVDSILLEQQSEESMNVTQMNLEGDPASFAPRVAILTASRLGLVKKTLKTGSGVSRNCGKFASSPAHSEDVEGSKRKRNTSGGTVARAGKSRFVCPNGDFAGVEDMVKNRLAEEKPEFISGTLPKLWNIDDVDERVDAEFHCAARGGGWSGWHCEGVPLRSLFALCFWHLLFPRSDSLSVEATGFKADVIPNVFLTPYQDAPLDLDTQSFYKSRQVNIERFDIYLFNFNLFFVMSISLQFSILAYGCIGR